MSLRRTALQRKSELRRTPIAVKPTTRARSLRQRTQKARRDTGPARATRDVVLDRSMGVCEMCGIRLYAPPRGWLSPHAIHHRQPRQMGGTSRPEINSPANLLLLCDGKPNACHPWIESHRAAAYELGLLVRAGADPAKKPVVLEGNDWYLLTDDGHRAFVETRDDSGGSDG